MLEQKLGASFVENMEVRRGPGDYFCRRLAPARQNKDAAEKRANAEERDRQRGKLTEWRGGFDAVMSLSARIRRRLSS